MRTLISPLRFLSAFDVVKLCASPTTLAALSWRPLLSWRSLFAAASSASPSSPPSPFIAASSALICATMRLSIFFIFLYGRYSVLHSGTWFSSMSFPNPTMAVKEARARWRALATTRWKE